MQLWKDGEGREWEAKITVRTVKEVKDRLNVNLLAIDGKDDIFTRLATDVCLLCDVLYVIHAKQCEQRGITDEGFGELLYGDTLDRASEALMEELVNFFPSKTRGLLKRAMDIGKREMDREYAKAEEALDKAEAPKKSTKASSN